MAVKMVLFDLDGTLLPMDMDEFTMGYFQMLAAKAAAQMARAEEAQETIPEDGNTALPTRKRAAARMRY